METGPHKLGNKIWENWGCLLGDHKKGFDEVITPFWKAGVVCNLSAGTRPD